MSALVCVYDKAPVKKVTPLNEPALLYHRCVKCKLCYTEDGKLLRSKCCGANKCVACGKWWI
jgi:hypothetical protein